MQTKKILIIDEARFARICSAILEKENYSTIVNSDLQSIASILSCEEFGLVITSYPYGAVILAELIKTKLPVIILSDRLNRDLAIMLNNVDKSLLYCMIKPLDYTKFRDLVNQIMETSKNHAESAFISSATKPKIRVEMRDE